MSFGAAMPPAILVVEHITDTLLYSRSTLKYITEQIPYSKPASPQIDYYSDPMDIYSKSLRVGFVSPISHCDNWGAILYYELVLNGVSQGIHTSTTLYGAPPPWGDFDPHVSHHIQVYFWVQPCMADQGWYRAGAGSGTVSDVAKVIWEKTILPAALVFSTDGIHDLDHLYIDDVLVTDYGLWWSGSKIVFKGTAFSVSGDLIYQRVIA